MSHVHPGKAPASSAPPPAIGRLEAWVLRWPAATPVHTSFGTMQDRPAVLVRVEDAEGAHGWGEAWCNFPACGAEHRARLIETVLAPLVVGRAFASPAAAYAEMTHKTAVLALQSGEPGPIAQAIAGVDIAMHDLAARRAGLPLWRHLGGSGPQNTTASTVASASEGHGVPAGAAEPDRSAAARRIRVYASGINPEQPGIPTTLLRVVGLAAFPEFGDGQGLSTGAAVSLAGINAVYCPPGNCIPTSGYLVTFRPGPGGQAAAALCNLC